MKENPSWGFLLTKIVTCLTFIGNHFLIDPGGETNNAGRHVHNQMGGKMKKLVSKFIRDEEGATAVEYGVMIALIIAVCIAVVYVIGTKINNAFDKVNVEMTKSIQ